MDKTLKGWQTYNHPRVSLQENEIVTRRKGEKTRGKAERGSRIIKPEGNLLSRTFENYSARDSRILSRLLSPRFSFGVSFLSIKKFLLRKERRVSRTTILLLEYCIPRDNKKVRTNPFTTSREKGNVVSWIWLDIISAFVSSIFSARWWPTLSRHGEDFEVRFHHVIFKSLEL